MTCQDPECARLRAEVRTALVRAEADLAEHQRLRTLGGPPPPVDNTWANKAQPGALRPEYAHLGDDTTRSSNPRRTT